MTNNINRGHIYLADLGSQVGSVQSGRRPVVVISNPQNNKYSPTINVLPITSQRKSNIPVHVDIGRECGLDRPSTVLTEQVITVDKRQLGRYIGKCSKDTMVQVTKAMLLQFYMAEDLNYVS